MTDETCGCPWAHCRLLCVTSCDHNDPCPHHNEPRRHLLAAWLRRAANRLEGI